MPSTASVRSSAVDRLVAVVRQRLATASATRPRVERVEVEVEAGDPLIWLAAQAAPVRHYWHGRGTTRRVAGVGSADVIESVPDAPFANLEKRVEWLRDAPSAVRYYGGMRFALAASASDIWQPFGVARFVLPRVEYVAEDGRTVLAANLVLPRDIARAGAGSLARGDRGGPERLCRN